MENNLDDYGILILSCDKFEDTWDPFFKLFDQNWADCPFDIYLGTNTKAYESQRVTNIFSGEDKDWSSSLKSILDQIDKKYLYIILDDLFIVEKVNSQNFINCFEFLNENNGNLMHYNPKPKPEKTVSSSYGEYGVYNCGMPYTVNVVGCWKVDYLKNLLLPGENPWNFEILGSYRASYSDGFYCVLLSPFVYLHSIEKGKWFEDAAIYLKEHNLFPDSNRDIIKNEFKLLSEIQKIYFSIFMKIPWRYRLKVMNILRKLLISY